VHCLRRPLLDYRQHAGNVLGARGGSARLPERLRGTRLTALCAQQQAATFLREFGEKMTPDQRVSVSAWANMPLTPHVVRLRQCLKKRFGKPGLRWFVS
jgi:hypothetical protein